MPTTTIQTNGPHRQDASIETLKELYEMLVTYPLRREHAWNDMPEIDAFYCKRPIWVRQDFRTDEGRCYIASDSQPDPGQVHFSGNFFGYSWAFSIYTDDPEIIKKLSRFIRINLCRDDYRKQETPSCSHGPHFIQFPDGSKIYFKGGKYYKRKPK